FTTSIPLEPGEIVKFGIKTDKPKPGINWKALTDSDKQIAIGKTLVSESSVIEPGVGTSSTNMGVLEGSTFRLIPEKLSVGSSIRVTGENFGANQILDFYIDTKKIQSFETDVNGHFIFTSSIPENQKSDRVDFKIKDSKGNEKSISLRIGEEGDRMSSSKDIPLTIHATPPVVDRGDTITVTGTGPPGTTITGTTKNESGEIVTTIAIDVDLDGKWSYDALIPIDTPFGKYTAEITDGTNVKSRSWIVESSKVIEILPTKLKFEPGETVTFNGTAKPNEELEIVVEDPQGFEFYSQIINVNSSGEVDIQFTTIPSSIQGTYVLFASQGEDIDIVLVGLGELPEDKLIIKFDKLNYSQDEILIIEIQGPASSTISLLIIDPSDKNKFTDTMILEPDGQSNYELDLTGYSSGVYTAVLTRANTQTSEIFSVGLLTGSGEIHVRSTKDSYQPGESILILGDSSKNVLLTLELRDPDGEVVKTKETFTNKDGVFSVSSIRIPLDAQIGSWTIHAQSGPNFDDYEITVQGDIEEGLVVYVDGVVDLPTGEFLSIKGYGASIKQRVTITLFDDADNEIDEIRTGTTDIGIFEVLWQFPDDFAPGTYLIRANDPVDEAETTYDYQ
ncbi:MAG: biofilm-associated protein, partial [Thaumarchaeota archaeon]|nr:biofilm-associated protein [Nitrososphaerota archaeon]